MSALERFVAAVARVFTRPVRFSLYSIGVAAFGVLLVYGLVNLQQTAAWLVLLSAALGLPVSSMAALNARRPSDRVNGGTTGPTRAV